MRSPRAPPVEWVGFVRDLQQHDDQHRCDGQRGGRQPQARTGLARIGTGNTRGGYKQIVLPAGSYDGGTNRTTFTLSLTARDGADGQPCTPARRWGCDPRGGVRPLRRLAPGDTLACVALARRCVVGHVPQRARIGIVQAGALSATTSLPVADQTPNQKQVVVLGQFLITA